MILKGPWFVRYIRTKIFKWTGIVLALIVGGVIVVHGTIDILILFLDTVNW